MPPPFWEEQHEIQEQTPKLSDIENQWNTWNVQAIVEANNGIDNERGKGYLPPDLVKYHELMHVEEIPKGISKKDDDARKGVEILTTTKTVMLEDYVYKKINNIPMDAVVDYHQSLKLGGKDVPLGQVAVFYEKLEQKYGNLAKAITLKESLSFLQTGLENQHYTKPTAPHHKADVISGKPDIKDSMQFQPNSSLRPRYAQFPEPQSQLNLAPPISVVVKSLPISLSAP